VSVLSTRLLEETNFWKEIVSGDGKWVFLYDPETKYHSLHCENSVSETEASTNVKVKGQNCAYILFDINRIARYNFFSSETSTEPNTSDLVVSANPYGSRFI
jgi:hypothetical protein